MPINEIFRTIKDQPWVRRLPPLSSTSHNRGSQDYCSYHEGKGHTTTDCRALPSYIQLVQEWLLRQYVLNPDVVRNSSSETGTLEPHEIKKESTPSSADIYKTVFAVFDATLVEGLTVREEDLCEPGTRRNALGVHHNLSRSAAYKVKTHLEGG